MTLAQDILAGFDPGTGALSDSSSMERDILEKLVIVEEITATGPTLTHINPSARPLRPAVDVMNVVCHIFLLISLKLC
jgi:hypothetical protein